jgi:hypothetical protein
MTFDEKMIIGLIALCFFVLASVILGLTSRFTYVGLAMLLLCEFCIIAFFVLAMIRGIS